MAISRTCDGMKRRDFLKVGVLGGAGISLSGYLQLAQAGEIRPRAKAESAIFINLNGGPSHMDTFDLKPESSDEYRGEFSPIRTNVPGVEFCEHLPKLAQCADKFAILRGVSHTLGAHRLGDRVRQHGQSSAAGIGVSRLWCCHDQGASRAARSASVCRHSQQ